MLLAGLTLLVLSPVGVRNWDVSHVSPLAWGGLAYSIVLGTVVATSLWSGAVKSVGASATMIYAYLSPILSVGFAALLLGEHLQVIQVVGALFVLAGVTLSQGRRVKV
jgi:O-acetylserine/cysteine efflux transporter